jgi:hypothetical protein
MSIELTHEQRQAVKRGAEPVRVHDPDTLREYVLVRAEVFERMRKLLQTESVDPSLYEFEELV